MENKYINRYRSFCNCINNLEKSKKANPDDDFVLEGTVQIFNLTFDLSWKVMKDILVKGMGITDFAVGSPRETLQTAFNNAIIDDDRWIEMLKTRNQLSHDYDGLYARKVFEQIINDYYSLFIVLSNKIEKYYKDDLFL